MKVACRDVRRIPLERLYEMNKKLHIVSFTVESKNGEVNGKKGDDDDGGDDGGKDKDEEVDDSDDLLDDENDLKHKSSEKSVDKTHIQNSGQKSGHKTVNMGLVTKDCWDQEKQLIASMNDASSKLLTTVEQAVEVQQSSIEELKFSILSKGKVIEKLDYSNNDAYEGFQGSGEVGLSHCSEGWKESKDLTLEGCSMSQCYQTPEIVINQSTECLIVGNKLQKLMSEESHHSKWEEFRKMAQSRNQTEECSNLPRRMELEESDGEDIDNVIEEEIHNEEKLSLDELQIKVPHTQDDGKEARKVF